jgi:DNA-binding LacI/PurR family transcriptional regulator
MTIKGLKHIKGKMPKNYIKMAMKETGVSEATVIRTMNGTSKKPNVKVREALIRIAEEYQRTLKSQNKKSQSI